MNMTGKIRTGRLGLAGIGLAGVLAFGAGNAYSGLEDDGSSDMNYANFLERHGANPLAVEAARREGIESAAKYGVKKALKEYEEEQARKQRIREIREGQEKRTTIYNNAEEEPYEIITCNRYIEGKPNEAINVQTDFVGKKDRFELGEPIMFSIIKKTNSRDSITIRVYPPSLSNSKGSSVSDWVSDKPRINKPDSSNLNEPSVSNFVLDRPCAIGAGKATANAIQEFVGKNGVGLYTIEVQVNENYKKFRTIEVYQPRK
jgi:hypothetical protein